MVETNSVENNYILIDKETVRTHLFNSLATGNVEPYSYGIIAIYIKGTQYFFDENLKLIRVYPESENAYALTTRGFVQWQNLARRINFQGTKYFLALGELVSEHYIINSLYSRVACINYICLDDPFKNYFKISKENLIADNFEFQNLNNNNLGAEIEEKDNKLIIKIKNDMIDSIGVKIGNMIYPFYDIDILYDLETVIPKGTCFRRERGWIFVTNNNEKKKYKYSNKVMYLCY